MPKSGHWRIESKTDPRFNMEGRGEFSNGYPIRLPADAVTGIERKSVELNSEPPEDLEFSFDRDASSYPPPEPEYVESPVDFLKSSGLLFEVNRRVLHPLGLALEVLPEEPGEDAARFRLWDCRRDPSGAIFTDDEFLDGLALLTEYMNATGARRLLARQTCLGFRVQGELDRN